MPQGRLIGLPKPPQRSAARCQGVLFLDTAQGRVCVVNNALSAGTRLGNLGGDALSTGGGLGPGSSQGVVHPFDRGTLPLG